MPAGLDHGRLSRVALAVALATVSLAVACKPKIGDACLTSTDCSQAGDRLCDTSQPGGYCTVFNCEPGSCPTGQSACVAFYPLVCGDPAQTPRWERTFCMRVCSGDSDCRSGYSCVDVASEPDTLAIIDPDPPGGSVCIATASVVASDAGTSDAICTAADASFPPVEDAATPSSDGEAGADASDADADAATDASDADASDADAATDASDADGDAATDASDDADASSMDAADAG